MPNDKTLSDKLFERYLEDQNLKFDHEKYLIENEKNNIQGENTPDYSVYFNDLEMLFEVKEIKAKEYYSGQFLTSTVDEVLKPIRNLINTASSQFKNLETPKIRVDLS